MDLGHGQLVQLDDRYSGVDARIKWAPAEDPFLCEFEDSQSIRG